MKVRVKLVHQVSYSQVAEVEVEALSVVDADILVEQLFLNGDLDGQFEIVDEDNKEYYEIFSEEIN